MPNTIGVDQGLDGALCWLTGLLDTDPKYVLKMPTHKGQGGKKRPDVSAIKSWLNDRIREHGIPDLVVVERSQAMTHRSGKGQKGKERHGQGVTSAHTTGLNAGIVIGVFDFLGYPGEEPTPQQWKKSVLSGYKEKDKKAMIEVCKQRFPSLSLLSSERAKNPHDGIADAVGLALYGQFRLGNVPT